MSGDFSDSGFSGFSGFSNYLGSKPPERLWSLVQLALRSHAFLAGFSTGESEGSGSESPAPAGAGSAARPSGDSASARSGSGPGSCVESLELRPGFIFSVDEKTRSRIDSREKIIANFEKLKHGLTQIYKQEAYAQSYELIPESDAVLIKPLIDKTPDYFKINCHYVPYLQQGLGIFQGAYDLCVIKAKSLGLPSLPYSNFLELEEYFRKFFIKMQGQEKSLSDPVTRVAEGHKIFNQELEIFANNILGFFTEIFPKALKQTLLKDLEQARLWAPLAFRPKSYIVMDRDGDILVREPVIIIPEPEVLSRELIKSGIKKELFIYHYKNLLAGRLIPAQLTDQGIKINGIGARNSWLISFFKKYEEDYCLASQVSTSGVFSFNSVDRAADIFIKLKAKLIEMMGVRPEHKAGFGMTVATLTTDSNLRDVGKWLTGAGNEASAHKIYKKLEDSLRLDGLITSPLFMRSLGTVYDGSTEKVIDQIFSETGLLNDKKAGFLKAFLDLSFIEINPTDCANDLEAKLEGARRLKLIYQLKDSVLMEISAEVDPVRQRLMHALLSWKMLEFNSQNAGPVVFELVLDKFNDEMSGQRPIYHIWQLALNATIHEAAGKIFNIQCKSGKDRTGLALTCHQILNKIYDPESGFLMGGKKLFIQARDQVFLRGDGQLIASEGGTQGCFGIMDNPEVREVFSRIFGVKYKDLAGLFGVLVSRQGNGRKAIKAKAGKVKTTEAESKPETQIIEFEQVAILIDLISQDRALAEKIDYLAVHYEALNKVSAGSLRVFERLSLALGLTSAPAWTCAESLKKLFNMAAKKGGALADHEYKETRESVVLAFRELLERLKISSDKKAVCLENLNQGLDQLIFRK